MSDPNARAGYRDPRIDDSDERIMRQCPFSRFIPSGVMKRADMERVKRIRGLIQRGFLHGVPTKKARDGLDFQVTLTRAGRIALGLAPEPPVP